MSNPQLAFTELYPTGLEHTPMPVQAEMERRNAAEDRVVAYLTAHGSATNVELCRPEVGGNRAIGRLWAAQRRRRINVRKEHVKGGIWKYIVIPEQERAVWWD